MKMKLITLAFVISLSFAMGCASTTTRHLTSASDFEKVFSAAKQAAIECRFGITSASSTEGLITAQQAVVMGQGSVVILNVQVTKTATGTAVQVAFVPPPGAAGNMDGYMKKYTDALKGRIPDVEVSTP